LPAFSAALGAADRLLDRGEPVGDLPGTAQRLCHQERKEIRASAKRLAIFSPSEPVALIQENSDNRYYRALFDELRRLDHVEGQNLTIERYAKEQNTAGPAALVAEVVRSNPDVVYVVGPGAPEFKAQTVTIPIVGLTGDPLALGLV
jgi:putative ABC transport system substrate-binding protein